MPIPVEKDDIGPPHELCCFCERPTSYWTKIKRRKPGDQVACCKKCAASNFQKDVPTKQEWCEYHERKFRESHPFDPRSRR